MITVMAFVLLASTEMAQPVAAQGGQLSIDQATGSYRLSGDRLLRPSLIWDDGAKTYLDWPANVELPAVFAIDGRGGETLVNGYLRNGRYVIDAVHSRLIFRLDRSMARADRRAERGS